MVKGFEDEARELLIQGQELREYAERGWESDETAQAGADRGAYQAREHPGRSSKTSCSEASENGRDTGGIEAMRAKVKEIQQAILRSARLSEWRVVNEM